MAKIFVLEDDKDIREIIEWTLEAEHFEVVSFVSVNDFMSRDASELPDLFILDVMLPDGSGLEVCKHLRVEGPQIPVLIMSAHASIEQVSNGCKADGFIQKPFELNLFLKTIRTHLNGNSLE